MGSRPVNRLLMLGSVGEAAPLTSVGRAPPPRLTCDVQGKKWSRRGESNPGPHHYESLSGVPGVPIRASTVPMLPTIHELSSEHVGKIVGKDRSRRGPRTAGSGEKGNPRTRRLIAAPTQ